MTFVLAGVSSASVVTGLAYAVLSYPAYRKTILLLTLIVLGLLGAHLYTINLPNTANCTDSSKGVQGCIMDEVYYVPAAQTMLSGEKCAPYADNCNLEHPFLSKAFIAAGIVDLREQRLRLEDLRGPPRDVQHPGALRRDAGR